jgi:hypothetical protein
MYDTSTFPVYNTPKGIGSDGAPDVPSAYRVTRFLCVNKLGVEVNILPIIKSFSIVEELFSPLIILNIKIRDTKNYFQDFAFSSEESIYLSMEYLTDYKQGKSTEATKKDVHLKFVVKEYPNYKKTAAEPNAQEYDIIAISEFGQFSALTKISRATLGNPIESIVKIFDDSLYTKTDVRSTCVTPFDGIITVQSPLSAVEWLRGKSFDAVGSPFFIYSNFTFNSVIIQSLNDLWDNKKNPLYMSYSYRQRIHNSMNSGDLYMELKTRILDMNSQMNIDKLSQAVRGAFASTTESTDIATKSYVKRAFDLLSSESPILKRSESNNSIFGKFAGNILTAVQITADKSLKNDIQRHKLNSAVNANISRMSTNSTGGPNGNPNSSAVLAANMENAKSFLANMDSISHNIYLYGDPDFNPGKRINLKIPKSISKPEYLGDDTADDELDITMSGDYLVAVAAHTFKEGLYTVRAKVIKEA